MALPNYRLGTQMIIKKAILHILDFNSDICVISQKELDVADFGTEEFIHKHIEKIGGDTAAQMGSFNDYSLFKETLDKYMKKQISFTDFSTAACNLLYQQVSKADEPESMDLLVCQWSDENREFMGMLILPNKIAYTHQVVSEEDGVANKIIRYYTLLPNTSQKITSYAVVDLLNYMISVCDKKRSISGEETMVLPDHVLGCSHEKSQREIVRRIKKAAVAVAEEFGDNGVMAVTRAKNFIKENAIENVPFTPSELGTEIFGENKMMKNSFEEKTRDMELPVKIRMENSKIVKSVSSHKIKTDTGIEIKIPTEHMEDNRYVEFINNPDGTLSIQLNNIGKITNR